MGTYLTDDQLERVKRELIILFSLPYSTDLFGTAWEQILAGVKGGSWTGIRDNRPNPDLYVEVAGTRRNYSVKCEKLKVDRARLSAANFLGKKMDFIVARPKADELLPKGQTIGSLDPTELGSLVLTYYNERIVKKYSWNVLSFLAPVIHADPRMIEFIYWEEEPPSVFNPVDYWWQDTGRATGSNRNIAGYPVSVSRGGIRPPAKFRWTSGGKQFYVLYDIPTNADTWAVVRTNLSREEIWEALQKKLEAKKKDTSAEGPLT